MTAATVRHPAVAGRFYPDDPDDLREEVRGYLSQSAGRGKTSARCGLHRSACGLYVFRPRGRCCLRRTRDSQSLPGAVSQPHRRGPRAGNHERGRMGDASRYGRHRQLVRLRSKAALPASARRLVRPPQRARRRSGVAVSADAPAPDSSSFPSRSAPVSSRHSSNSAKPLRM